MSLVIFEIYVTKIMRYQVDEMGQSITGIGYYSLILLMIAHKTPYPTQTTTD